MKHLRMDKKLFDKIIALVEKSFDIRAYRHKVISAKVANVRTRGYVSKDLPFQKVLERYLEPPSAIPLAKTHPGHLPPAEPGPRDFSSEVEGDPSSGGVNIDEQMAKLAENNLMFQAGIQALIKKFEVMKTVISETR